MKRGFLNKPMAHSALAAATKTNAQFTPSTAAATTSAPAKLEPKVASPAGKVTPTRQDSEIPPRPPPLVEIYYDLFTADELLQRENIPKNMVFTALPIYPQGDPLPWSTCMLHEGIKERIIALPGFPHPLLTPKRTSYIVRPAGEKGFGMFATHDLDVGDLIIDERPILVVPQGIPYVPNVPESMHPDQFFDFAVKRMSQQQQMFFFLHHDCKRAKGEQKTHRGIMDTNGLALHDLPGTRVPHVGMCDYLSYVNHSCAPNAVYNWHLNSFSYQLRALQPIRAGEEITLQYGISATDTRAVRRAILLKKYSFTCMCRVCALPDMESKRSDTRRAVLWKSSQVDPDETADVKKWMSDLRQSDDHLIVMGMKYIKMIEEESMWFDVDVWARQFVRVLGAHLALGNEAEAKEWGEKITKLVLAVKGEAEAEKWEKWVRGFPGSCEYWGGRVKARLGL